MPDDRVTANLPAADFAQTRAFYQGLGFGTDVISDNWMILSRGALMIEFYHHPEVDPLASWSSACIRVDDLDGLYAAFLTAGLPSDCAATPRLTPPVKLPEVPRMFALIDCNGSLLRCLENGSA